MCVYLCACSAVDDADSAKCTQWGLTHFWEAAKETERSSTVSCWCSLRVSLNRSNRAGKWSWSTGQCNRDSAHCYCTYLSYYLLRSFHPSTLCLPTFLHRLLLLNFLKRTTAGQCHLLAHQPQPSAKSQQPFNERSLLTATGDDWPACDLLSYASILTGIKWSHEGASMTAKRAECHRLSSPLRTVCSSGTGRRRSIGRPRQMVSKSNQMDPRSSFPLPQSRKEVSLFDYFSPSFAATRIPECLYES